MSLLLLSLLALWLGSFVFFVLALRSAPTITDEEELAALAALQAQPAWAGGPENFSPESFNGTSPHPVSRCERDEFPVAV